LPSDAEIVEAAAGVAAFGEAEPQGHGDYTVNRRNFVRAAAGLFPTGWLANRVSAVSNTQINEASRTEQSKSFDVRGIVAIYDLPDPRPKSTWHSGYFSLFDARKDHRYDGDFWDRERWDKYFTLWSREGYNTVFWYGPNELMTGDQMLVRFNEFPEARELSGEQSEKIIGQVKWLFHRAKELGMKNILYGDFIHYTQAFEIAHGLDKAMPKSPDLMWVYRDILNLHCGVRNELTRKYTEALIHEICTTYEDLDGFNAPMGECCPGDRSTFYKEAIVPGLKRSGRNLVFMVIGWETPLDDYLKNIAPKDIYENTWLGWHAYNAEQVTDPKPYPNLVGWAERVGLPTVATFYPSNVSFFPFNSPEFGYEMAFEMKRIPNFRGFMHWEYTGRKLSPLFRKALAYYAKTDEPYSDGPWLDILEEQFGDRHAAKHFLDAYNISARIIPDKSALVWDPMGFPRGELHLPYSLVTGNTFQWNWAVSPVRTEPLQPIWHYAAWAARHPHIFRDQNGSDWRTPHDSPLDFHQGVLWRTRGGSSYDTIPPVHMAKIRTMGETCLAEAERGFELAKKNRDEAAQAVKFMKGYKLLSAYSEKKVAAAIAGMVYFYSRAGADKQQAETLAEEAVLSYEPVARFLHQELDPLIQTFYGAPIQEMSGAYLSDPMAEMPSLLEAERKERAQFADLFFEEKNRYSDSTIG
jgi:hypothetical protein